MALSQDEQRMLAEIERRLAADDPGLASCLTTFRRPGPATVLRSPRARIIGSLFTVLLVAMVALMVYAMIPFHTHLLGKTPPTAGATANTAGAPAGTAISEATTTTQPSGTQQSSASVNSTTSQTAANHSAATASTGGSHQAGVRPANPAVFPAASP